MSLSKKELDALQNRRQVKGKLRGEELDAMLREYIAGAKVHELTAKYHVSHQTIYDRIREALNGNK